MQKLYNIIIASFGKKALEAGFYFVVVMVAAYISYQNIPKIMIWYINREDQEKIVLRRELHYSDSINRAAQYQMLQQLKDCYQDKK